jgi:hypothetical protein
MHTLENIHGVIGGVVRLLPHQYQGRQPLTHVSMVIDVGDPEAMVRCAAVSRGWHPGVGESLWVDLGPIAPVELPATDLLPASLSHCRDVVVHSDRDGVTREMDRVTLWGEPRFLADIRIDDHRAPGPQRAEAQETDA